MTKLRLTFLIAGLTIISVFFQNCGRSFEADSSSSVESLLTENLKTSKNQAFKEVMAARSLSCQQDSDCQMIEQEGAICGGLLYTLYSSESDKEFLDLVDRYYSLTNELAQHLESTGEFWVCAAIARVRPQSLSCVENTCQANFKLP